MIRRKLSSRSSLSQAREEATAWADKRAVNTIQALEFVGARIDYMPVRDLFPDVFVFADQQAESCPVAMGGAGNIDLLYWLTVVSDSRRIVETGVAYGWSSLAILLALRNRGDAALISTDMPYPGLNNAQYVGCVVPEELRSNWTLLPYPDRQALPKAIAAMEIIDMCHYDSDKSYEGRMWAYNRLWRGLKGGAFFISDDVSDNMAFADFATSQSLDPIVIQVEQEYVGLLIKPDRKKRGTVRDG